MDTFLTESKNQNPEVQLLANVRKDHQKLEAVVGAFGSKVEHMIDKQRNEYVQAYGHHMRDVQKELHLLREKATAIANDRTRDEKLKKLDSDQKWYRNEAIRLDAETNVLRKKLKHLTAHISSIERERDWLLAKLREAKAKYRELQTLRANKASRLGHGEEGMSLLSNDSSFTLEIGGHLDQTASTAAAAAGHKVQAWKNRLESDYGVSRDHAMIGALGHMIGQSHPAQHAGGDGEMAGAGSSSTGHYQHTGKSTRISGSLRSNGGAKAGKRTLGRLVAARAKKEALGDFINQCASSCGKGAFARGPAIASSNRSGHLAPAAVAGGGNIETLIESCLQHLTAMNNPGSEDSSTHGPNQGAVENGFDTFSSVRGGSNSVGNGSFCATVEHRTKNQSSHFHNLIKDLATHPEVYIALSDIMSGVQKSAAAAAIRPLSPGSPGSPTAPTPGGAAGRLSRSSSSRDFGGGGGNVIEFTNVQSDKSGVRVQERYSSTTGSSRGGGPSSRQTERTVLDGSTTMDYGYGAGKKSRADAAAEAANPTQLRVDRDVLAYLTMGSDRRAARKEMKEYTAMLQQSKSQRFNDL